MRMAAALRGMSVFWGVGSSFAFSGTGIVLTNTTLNPQSVRHSKESERAMIPNYAGEDVAQVFFNAKEVMTVDVIPTATTAAAIAASVITLTPNPGTQITVVDTDDTSAAGSSTTCWTFISGEKTRNNKNPMAVTYTLERAIGRDLSATPA